MKNRIIISNKGVTSNDDKVSLFIKWRYFLIQLIINKFKNFYKQTVLGPFWAIINPIIFSGVFTVIFGKVANLPTDGAPQFLFFLSSVIIWNLFRSALSSNVDLFVSSLPIFKNSYFPRILVPLANLIECLIIFSIQIFIFIFAIFFYKLKFNFTISIDLIDFLKIFIILFYIIILSFAFGLIFSCLNSKYRDIQHMVNFGMQFLFYGTPIVYSISMIPENYKFFFLVNPLVYPITLFKSITIGSQPPEIVYIYSSIIILVLALPISLIFFSYVERRFDDYI